MNNCGVAFCLDKEMGMGKTKKFLLFITYL